MTGVKAILIIALIIAVIKEVEFILKKDKIGMTLAGVAVAFIAALAGILAVPNQSPGTVPDSSNESTANTDSGTGSNDDYGSDSSSGSRTVSTSNSRKIRDIIHSETECEGIIKAYDSFTDINDHQRNDVIYMEYDGSPCSIIIHTNEIYSRISFDFYAASGMEPNEMAVLSLIVDDDTEPIRETAAIPTYNPSGRFVVDINGADKIKITFRCSGIPSAEHPCAVLIDNLTLK